MRGGMLRLDMGKSGRNTENAIMCGAMRVCADSLLYGLLMRNEAFGAIVRAGRKDFINRTASEEL